MLERWKNRFEADIQCCGAWSVHLWRQDEQLLWIAEHAMNAEPQSLEIFKRLTGIQSELWEQYDVSLIL